MPRRRSDVEKVARMICANVMPGVHKRVHGEYPDICLEDFLPLARKIVRAVGKNKDTERLDYYTAHPEHFYRDWSRGKGWFYVYKPGLGIGKRFGNPRAALDHAMKGGGGR